MQTFVFGSPPFVGTNFLFAKKSKSLPILFFVRFTEERVIVFILAFSRFGNRLEVGWFGNQLWKVDLEIDFLILVAE